MRQFPATPTVLIVDDNEAFRRATREVLRQAGYTVAEAENGLAALRELGQTGPPDLILLDLLMPGMDGWQLRERLSADPEMSRVPVVVTTAVGKEYQRENLLAAVAYMPKPCSAHAALAIVQKHCPLRNSAFGCEAGLHLPVEAA